MSKYDKFAVSNIIRELRENKNLTQTEMAEELAISAAHYSQIEQGRHGMSMDVLFDLMNCFGVDANTILGLSEETKLGPSKFDLILDKLTELEETEQEYIIEAWQTVLDSYLKGKEVAA